MSWRTNGWQSSGVCPTTGVSLNAWSVGRFAERQPLLCERPSNDAKGLRPETVERRQILGRDSGELTEGGVTGTDQGAPGGRTHASWQFAFVRNHRGTLSARVPLNAW